MERVARASLVQREVGKIYDFARRDCTETAIPQSKIKDFRQPPLGKGAFAPAVGRASPYVIPKIPHNLPNSLLRLTASYGRIREIPIFKDVKPWNAH